MQETETAALTGGGSGQASRDTVSTLMPTGRMAWQDGTAGRAAGKVLLEGLHVLQSEATMLHPWLEAA